jgi:polyphenol oxidase
VGGLIERERDGIKFFTSELLEPHDEVAALVTTRHGGVSAGPFATLNLGGKTKDDPLHVRENRTRVAALVHKDAKQLAFAKQVHGANIALVPSGFDGGAFDDVDALITNAPQTPLVILTADCAAIFLFDPVHNALGIAHAGWRGTVADIAAHTARRMHGAFDTWPRDLIACIGPSIGPCCYEVGEEVIAAVEESMPDFADEVLVEPDMASAGSFRASVNEGHKHFDLWRANELMLAEIGIREQNIEIARLCTACRTDLFYSHRAEQGVTGRFSGLLMLR